MGGSGHKAPRNVVYRSEGLGTAAHKLAQWQGSSSYQAPIYHEGPETQVHAHKQALHLTKHEEETLPRDGDDGILPTEPAEELVVEQPVAAFDFGDFDYDWRGM